MKHLIKAALAVAVVPCFLIGCSSTSQDGAKTTGQTRIYLPRETIITQRPMPPKVIPYTYHAWSSVSENLRQAREYDQFLQRNQVGNIIPMHELLRTARDWEKCGRSQYMVPNRELWSNQIPTLTVFKYLVASKVLTEYEVTSVYRDLPLNKCAGGANSSRHLFNSAIDFRIGPQYPRAEDYAFIEASKFKLCQFWSQHGQSLNMGLGLYASGQVHIDTQGFRTWGPDLSRRSSMCNYNGDF